MYVVMKLNEGYNSSLDKYLVLSKYLDVFKNELTRLPPKWEVDFSIELKPVLQPISKTPYQMTTLEIWELSMQV
jgi:hypothetical protein